jgi:hypothetical protein
MIINEELFALSEVEISTNFDNYNNQCNDECSQCTDCPCPDGDAGPDGDGNG